MNKSLEIIPKLFSLAEQSSLISNTNKSCNLHARIIQNNCEDLDVLNLNLLQAKKYVS